MTGQTVAPCGTPFSSAAEAWFWTMRALVARRDGAPHGWRPDVLERPCCPDDVVRMVDRLYRARVIDLAHAYVLRRWGERQVAPPQRGTYADLRLWAQVMGHLEISMREKRIVQ